MPFVGQASCLVDTLKGKVRDWFHVPPDHHRLYFGSEELEDGHALSDYDMRLGDVIYLQVPMMHVFVTFMSGKTIMLDVDPYT